MEPLEPMAPEQLRSVVQARLSEFQAYQYMEQVLAAVVNADETLAKHKAALSALQDETAAKAQALDELDSDYSEKEANLSERMQAKQASAQAALDALTAEIDKKTATLKNWQAQLSSIEEQHKATLAQWQARIELARSEYQAVSAQVDQAKKQFDAFAALVGRTA